MHSVLIPVDGSSHARKALKYAISAIKEGYLADIHIINVQPLVYPIGELPLFNIEQIEENQSNWAKKSKGL